MNVENRKLFTNRDARAKLATMGGIMASSPELLGEVQRFANGDEVVVPKFIINIPGLVPAGRFLQIDASTLQMLQGTIPDLMTQENVLIEEATPALLDTINPYSLIESGDREVVDRLQDMSVEVPQSEAEGPGIMDRVSSLFGFGGDDSAAFVPRFPGDTQFQQDMVARDATPPAAVAGIETLGDVTEAFGPGNTFTSGRELASAEEQKQTEITESEQLLSAQDQQRDATPPDGYQIITNRSGAPQSVNQNRINPEKIAKITKRFANGEITEAQYQGQKKEYENAILQDNAHKAYSADQQAETDAANAKDDAAQAAISEATLESRIAEAEKNNDTALVEALRETKKTPEQNQIEADAITQNDADAMDLEDAGSEGPSNLVDITTVLNAIDNNESTSDALVGGVTGTNQNLTPKESVKAYQAIFKEMLGVDDEDKEKEKYHQMAMIGFAIAAGQDPNALSNVAGGLLEGTKLARKDRKDKKALMAKVNMAAFDAARQDTQRSDDLANKITLAGMTGGYRKGLNPNDFAQKIYSEAFTQYAAAVGDALTGRKPPADALPGESQEQYAKRKGNLGYDYAVADRKKTGTAGSTTPTYTIGQRENDAVEGLIEYTKDGWRKVATG